MASKVIRMASCNMQGGVCREQPQGTPWLFLLIYRASSRQTMRAWLTDAGSY